MCLTLKEAAKLFSKVAGALCIPTRSRWGFQLLHILIWYCLSGFRLLQVSTPSIPWDPRPANASYPPRFSHPLCPTSQAWLRPKRWQEEGLGEIETFRLHLFWRPGLRWNFKCSLSLSKADSSGHFSESLTSVGPKCWFVHYDGYFLLIQVYAQMSPSWRGLSWAAVAEPDSVWPEANLVFESTL